MLTALYGSNRGANSWVHTYTSSKTHIKLLCTCASLLLYRLMNLKVCEWEIRKRKNYYTWCFPAGTYVFMSFRNQTPACGSAWAWSGSAGIHPCMCRQYCGREMLLSTLEGGCYSVHRIVIKKDTNKSYKQTCWKKREQSI